jgi:hypothetical protein
MTVSRSRKWKYIIRVPLVVLVLAGCGEMDTKWTRDVDMFGPGNYRIASISSIKDGIFLTGTYFESETTSTCFTAKYDTDGVLEWFSALDEPGTQKTAGIQITVTPTQADLLTTKRDIYILAWASDTTGDQRIILANYDTLGNSVWQKTAIVHEGTLDATLLSDTEGGLYVAGWGRDIENRSTVYIGKYAASGEVEWFTKYFNDEIDFNELKCDIMRSGRLILAGVLTFSGEVFYINYNDAGQFLGFTTHRQTKVSELSDVKIAPEGNVYITAGVYSPETGKDYLTIAYGKNDSLRWVSQYDGAAHRNDTPKALAIDESLNVYVAGKSENAQQISSITVVKYDSSGAVLWTRNIQGGKAAEPVVMEPRYLRLGRHDEIRHLYIAGTSDDKALIVKCTLQGVCAWTKEFDNGGKITKPVALSGKFLALSSTENGRSAASIVKIGPSTILGITRWD